MVIKRIIGQRTKKYRSCLRCGQPIEKVLQDDTVHTCEHCGQQHFVDVYVDRTILTVVERPEVRRRPATQITPDQRKARKELIERAEKRRQEDEAWIEKYKDWLEELAAMPQTELVLELSFMDADMLRRVNLYFEKRSQK